MRNIDKFNEFSAIILAQLYESFLRPIRLDSDEISGSGDRNEFGESSPESEICFYTMKWLYDCGYIFCDEGDIQHDYGILRATLSPKGLELLKLVPDSVNTKKSTGDKLVELCKKKATDTAGSMIGNVMSESFVYFGKLLGV